MPTYESACPKCKKLFEYITTVADRNNPPKCCGKPTVRETRGAPEVGAMTWTGWKGTTVNGQYFDSGDKLKKYMKVNNLIPQSEAKSATKEAKARKKKEYDRKLTETITRVVCNSNIRD